MNSKTMDDWSDLGYTLEQIKTLEKDYLINSLDIANISAGESYKYLKETMDKYKINESDAIDIIEKLFNIDEHQVLTYEELKAILNNMK